MRLAILTTALLGVLVAASCGRGTVTREEWKGMEAKEKVLLVSSLMGHEQAAERKGRGRRPPPVGLPESYVDRIEDAYAGGAREDVASLFEKIRVADGRKGQNLRPPPDSSS